MESENPDPVICGICHDLTTYVKKKKNLRGYTCIYDYNTYYIHITHFTNS